MFIDQSIHPGSEGDDIMRAGTAMDLLNSHNAQLKGKPLDCSDFPMPQGDPPSAFLSTDGRALSMTWDLDHCPATFTPQESLWGLCGTQGCRQVWRVDTAGLATRIAVMCGVKVWFIARQKETNASAGSGFCPARFDVTDVYLDTWDVEVVVLSSGDEL